MPKSEKSSLRSIEELTSRASLLISQLQITVGEITDVINRDNENNATDTGR
jgi:hypothetical protein